MGSPSTSTQKNDEERKSLDYPELVKKLDELGVGVRPTRADYSRARRSIKAFIAALLEKLQEVKETAKETTGKGKLSVALTREEAEYIIYRLRTIYGDSRATSIIAKLADALRSS